MPHIPLEDIVHSKLPAEVKRQYRLPNAQPCLRPYFCVCFDEALNKEGRWVSPRKGRNLFDLTPLPGVLQHLRFDIFHVAKTSFACRPLIWVFTT